MRFKNNQYISTITKIRPANSGEVSVYIGHKDKYLLVNSLYYNFLNAFSTPKTLEEATQILKNQGWKKDTLEMIPSIFMEMEFQDCLKPLESIFPSNFSFKQPHQIKYIAILTQNNPESLAESIKNWSTILVDSGITLIIADASDNLETKNLVRNFSQNYSGNIIYLGDDEREIIASKFMELKDPSLSILLTSNISKLTSLKNLLLLVLGGKSFLLITDNLSPEFTLHSSANIGEITITHSDFCIENYNPCDINYLNYENLTPEILNSINSGKYSFVNFDSCNINIIQNFYKQSQNIVAISLGDKTAKYNLDNFNKSEYCLKSNITGSYILQSENLIINNQKILPPFIPIDNMNVNLWGLLVNKLDNGNTTINSPYIFKSNISHPLLLETDNISYKTLPSEILYNIINSKNINSYTALGEILMETGSLLEKEFNKLIYTTIKEVNNNKINQLKTHLKDQKSKDSRKHIKYSIKSLTNNKKIKNVISPQDFYKLGEAINKWIIIYKKALEQDLITIIN